MSGLINFAVYLVIVFVSAYALCLVSANSAMEDLIRAEWRALTKEQQDNDALRFYFASLESHAATRRQIAIANWRALQFACGTSLVWSLAYLILAGAKP